MTWNGVTECVIQLFGHVHTHWRGAEGQVNVGVDQWDFARVTPRAAALATMTLPPSDTHMAAEGEADQGQW